MSSLARNLISGALIYKKNTGELCYKSAQEQSTRTANNVFCYSDIENDPQLGTRFTYKMYSVVLTYGPIEYNLSTVYGYYGFRSNATWDGITLATAWSWGGYIDDGIRWYPVSWGTSANGVVILHSGSGVNKVWHMYDANLGANVQFISTIKDLGTITGLQPVGTYAKVMSPSFIPASTVT